MNMFELVADEFVNSIIKRFSKVQYYFQKYEGSRYAEKHYEDLIHLI